MSGDIKNLIQMESGERGCIVGIAGGHGLARRLETLGIRPGVEIIKVVFSSFEG